MTITARQRLDAFDQWCQRHIRHIPYTAHVPNLTVRKRTKQSRLTSTILDRRLKLFGHIHRAGPSSIMPGHLKLPSTIYERIGDVRAVVPTSQGLRTIKGDLKTQNIGSFSAWHIARRCSRWHHVNETAVIMMMIIIIM